MRFEEKLRFEKRHVVGAVTGSRADRFAARPYDLRHAAVSFWPNGGVAGGAERDLAEAVQAGVALEASGAHAQDAGPVRVGRVPEYVLGLIAVSTVHAVN